MKKALIIVGCFVIAAIAQLGNLGKLQEKFGLASRSGDDVFESAFEEHRANFVAEGSGTVTRVLSDDNEGSPHQRFIVTLPSGQTLLISHNIDLAHRWNDKGGVVHWTHRDPEGRHEPGWIRHGGNTYE